MSNQVITVEYVPQEFEKNDDPIEQRDTHPASSTSTTPKRRKVKTFFIIALASLALLALMILFWRISAGSNYVRFEPSLLTISVTFAVFAVNFSFVEYQLSPYRALFRGIAWMHVLSALCVLLIAIIPIGAALTDRAPGRVAASLLPLIAVSSVLLALVARRCADPMRRAEAASDGKIVQRFAKQLASAAKRELDWTVGLNHSKSGDGPSHEWEYRLPPRVDFYDPFDSLLALASASASNGDGQVFEKATDRMVAMLKIIASYKPLTLQDGTEADYRVRSLVLDHSHERLVQLARMTLDTDKIDRFTRGFAEALAFHLRIEAARSRQTEEFARIVTNTLSFLAVETYKRGWRTTAMRTLMVVRECVSIGVRRPPETEEARWSFLHELVRFPHVVDALADAALEKRDSEFLYRCLDTLGWMGCTAVKADKKDVGLACAQSLVQLARKSRFKKLECFWPRCGMLPWQHARERIEWMLSWVPSIKGDVSRKQWLESFSEAYSRIDGSGIEINIEKEGEKPLFRLKRSGKPHTITYMESDTVTYDFSDESMLRDLQLY